MEIDGERNYNSKDMDHRVLKSAFFLKKKNSVFGKLKWKENEPLFIKTNRKSCKMDSKFENFNNSF